MKSSDSESSDSDSTEDNENATKKIFKASEKGNLPVVVDLLTSDKNLVNVKDEDHYTPLHRASYNNHPEVVKVLLEAGAPLESLTIDGWTPLHSACNWNSFKCASLLLDAGANIQAQTNSGQTPLHLAASNRKGKETLELLLFNYFVDTKVLNTNGETAQQLARRCGPFAYLFESEDPVLDPFSSSP